ncbi:prephenate dehydrogenase/arogenate dehydrogenase family protein [Oscillospiraceae bacterium PP1C4]
MFGFEGKLTLDVGVVGLGLIGGSMAKALKKYTSHLVFGCDINEDTLSYALEQGTIDEKIADGDSFACDLVLIALYPQQTVDFVKRNISRFKTGAMIVDLCGVKQYPVDELTDFCAEHKVIFIGGHPMAGRECWGFSGSDADLFQGASMIITPDERTPQPAIELLSGLFTSLGFGSITTATPAAHDSMIAFTSQLAHVVSSAYVKSPRAQQHNGFSAGSYNDLTRVAKLNAQMWTELFLENADNLVEEIDTIIVHLDEYREAIANRNPEQLYALLEEGRKIKEALDQ